MALEAQDNPFPYVTLTETADPSTPAANTQRLWLDTDGVIKVIDESATVTPVISASGAVGTDAIWDAAGDLAVGTGANTAAKLTMGAEGSMLSVMDGVVGWNGATSMPSGPTTGQRCWRSDLGQEYLFDGTRWISSVIHQMTIPVVITQPISASNTTNRSTVPALVGGSDIWLVSAINSFYVVGGTALSGSHKWVGTLSKHAGGTSLGTYTVDSGATDTWRASTAITIGAALGSFTTLELAWVKTGTPGNLFSNVTVTYRTIAT